MELVRRVKCSPTEAPRATGMRVSRDSRAARDAARSRGTGRAVSGARCWTECPASVPRNESCTPRRDAATGTGANPGRLSGRHDHESLLGMPERRSPATTTHCSGLASLAAEFRRCVFYGMRAMAQIRGEKITSGVPYISRHGVVPGPQNKAPHRTSQSQNKVTRNESAGAEPGRVVRHGRDHHRGEKTGLGCGETGQAWTSQSRSWVMRNEGTGGHVAESRTAQVHRFMGRATAPGCGELAAPSNEGGPQIFGGPGSGIPSRRLASCGGRRPSDG